MPRNKFYDAKGFLTAYALACGYRHKQGEALFYMHDSGGAYCVEKFDASARGVVTSDGRSLRDGIAFYENFQKRADAIKAFRAQVGDKLARRFESAPDIRRNVIA